ncbi:MAG: DUF2330 domain-containing protein [Kofleriaceae bacterium]
MRTRLTMAAAVVAATVATPTVANAFCGFYVSGSGDALYNDATQVVLMREGTRTVLSMQNDYKGPPEAFALVVPVPVVLQEDQVKTLSKDVFAKVDQMASPRLVEYWEQDPCAPEPKYEELPMPTAAALDMAAPARGAGGDLGVTIEAQFAVGEYQIVILSAKDSTGLDTWLRQEKYAIPAGAEPLLAPYVAAGSKFFVAKVDPAKVIFEGGRAALSPLRFHYDSEEFALPIRLGLANSSGTQDLIVHILARGQRYEVANYENVTIPTNLDVKDGVRTRFGEFYAALFDKTVAKHPRSVVTEYAWDASTCDPCPGPNLDGSDFATLGADVLGDGTRDGRFGFGGFVLTRLHARYGTELTEDLVFKAAPPIVGGREFVVDGGKLEERSRPASTNNFQARYAIRHAWTGAVACKDPKRGRWGGPPAGVEIAGDGGPTSAGKTAFAPRGTLELAAQVASDIPELDIKAGSAASATVPPAGSGGSAASATVPPAGSGGSAASPPPAAPAAKKGCGCQATGVGDVAGGGLLVVGVLLGLGRRKRRTRVDR